MPGTDKLVLVTRKTALDELVERFATRDQARFYIEHMGGEFAPYQAAHDTYHAAIADLKSNLPRGVRTQWIERSYLPTFTFGQHDVVLTLGQDGLVVNTAKYLDGQPLVAVNPDPERIDGVLLPFNVQSATAGIERALSRRPVWANVSMAEAQLNDGQRLLAVNDLFIGQKTHTSARYRLRHGTREEDQSSSGIIVSTGAGSTGWLRSILTGAAGVVEGSSDHGRLDDVRARYRFDWEKRELVFSVREPFISRTSQASIVFGRISEKHPLQVTSFMPSNGVIFSDGVEQDYLEFASGSIARIALADRVLRLVQPG
jgi:hypothetical protein